MKVVIIGAGAAGCFAGIEIKRLMPDAEVTILEKNKRPLMKVAITGGGRCNLTNSFAEVRSLEQAYPRGHRLMKKLFHHFSHKDAYEWFEDKAVRLLTQDDECVFPVSQDAMEIVNTLLRLLNDSGVRILTDTKALSITENTDDNESCALTNHGEITDSPRWTIATNHGEITADKVLVTTGGHPTMRGYDMFRNLDIEIIPSLPSLFSFCIDNDSLKALMGTVVKEAAVSLPGTKLRAEGALLVTHWGISGPATLKFSSYAARVLAEKDYVTDVAVKWLLLDNNEIMDMLHTMATDNRDKKLSSVYPEEFNQRLWVHLLLRASLNPDNRWKELREKDFNRLQNTLTNDTYHMTGKNPHKEEFVTCGGISLNSLHHNTLESKKHPGLHFAGEVTDVDAITGGFNLQAAWTMAHVAAHGICAN